MTTATDCLRTASVRGKRLRDRIGKHGRRSHRGSAAKKVLRPSKAEAEQVSRDTTMSASAVKESATRYRAVPHPSYHAL